MIENTLKNIESVAEILHDDFTSIRKILLQKKNQSRWKHIAKMSHQPKGKQKQQENDKQKLLEHSINLPMEIEVNRKRRFNTNNEYVNDIGEDWHHSYTF